MFAFSMLISSPIIHSARSARASLLAWLVVRISSSIVDMVSKRATKPLTRHCPSAILLWFLVCCLVDVDENGVCSPTLSVYGGKGRRGFRSNVSTATLLLLSTTTPSIYVYLLSTHHPQYHVNPFVARLSHLPHPHL